MNPRDIIRRDYDSRDEGPLRVSIVQDTRTAVINIGDQRDGLTDRAGEDPISIPWAGRWDDNRPGDSVDETVLSN